MSSLEFGILSVCLGLFALGIYIGHTEQAKYCYSTLNDGRKYVVIEEDRKDAFYLLGERIPKPKKIKVLPPNQEGQV